MPLPACAEAAVSNLQFPMCRGWESNPHSLRNTILSRARMTSFATPATGVNIIYFETKERLEPANKSFADSRVSPSPRCRIGQYTTIIGGLNHRYSGGSFLHG